MCFIPDESWYEREAEMKLNELDRKFAVDELLGIAMVIIGIFFDPIAGALQIQHNTEHLPVLQIIWTVVWGIWTAWTIWYQSHYGE